MENKIKNELGKLKLTMVETKGALKVYNTKKHQMTSSEQGFLESINLVVDEVLESLNKIDDIYAES